MLQRIRSTVSTRSLNSKEKARKSSNSGGVQSYSQGTDAVRPSGEVVERWTVSSLEDELERLKNEQNQKHQRKEHRAPSSRKSSRRTSASRKPTHSANGRESEVLDSRHLLHQQHPSLDSKEHTADSYSGPYSATSDSFSACSEGAYDAYERAAEPDLQDVALPLESADIAHLPMEPSPITSDDDFFKIHYSKTGPIPPARKVTRARVSTTPSPVAQRADASIRAGSTQCSVDTEESPWHSSPIPPQGLRDLKLENASYTRENSPHPTPNARLTLPANATISRAASSTFDAKENVLSQVPLLESAGISTATACDCDGEGARDSLRSQGSIPDMTDATPRAEKTQLQCIPSSSTATVGAATSFQSDLCEKVKTCLEEYNTSVQQACDAIYDSAKTAAMLDSESGKVAKPVSGKENLPDPLRRMGLRYASLDQRQSLLQGLLQHLVHLHFFSEVANVFCFGCGTQENEAASTLMEHLKLKASLRSLLTYQSQMYAILSSTASPQARLHITSQTLTRLHTHIAVLFVWSGVVARRSDAASHTMKGYGRLKQARDLMMALCRHIRSVEETCVGVGVQEELPGWFDVIATPSRPDNEPETISGRRGVDVKVIPPTPDRAIASTPPSEPDSVASTSPKAGPPAVIAQDFGSSSNGSRGARYTLSPPVPLSPSHSTRSSTSASRSRPTSLSSCTQPGSRMVTFDRELDKESENKRSRQVVLLVQALGLTFLPVPTRSKSDATYQVLKQSMGNGQNGQQLEVLTEAKGKWM